MNFAVHFGKVLIFCTMLSFSVALNNIGFLFTSPKTFCSGSNENVCITFRNQTEDIKVKVVILQRKEDIEIASASEEITLKDRGGKCFKISMPRTKVSRGRLQLTIHSKTEEDFKINYVEQIFIQTDPEITFIQTDKPVYNSGHVVRIRIFTLRSDLTPILEPVEKIWIENPNGIHLVQWLNESSNQGFISKTFQLSKEPLPGKWTIKVQRRNEHIISQSFSVENYILPKFSVAIKAGDFPDFPGKNLTVCAKYFFGQPVHGDVILQYFIKCSFSYYCQASEVPSTRNLRLNADGCVHHRVSLNNLSSFAQSLVVNATVVEDETRIQNKATYKVEIRNFKKKNQPEFIISTKNRKFKPGLPFRGQVMVNGELAKQKIWVCLSANDEETCKELIVRKNKAEFALMPVPIKNENNFSCSLEIKYQEVDSETNIGKKLILTPWYSSSNSYLQLEVISDEPLRCGQKAKLNVLYSSPNHFSPLQFHYMIKARGDIIAKGNLNDFHTTSRPFYGWSTLPLINEGSFENVRHFQFFIDITPFMAPYSSLVVYFIRSDGEVVADTLNLKVEKCLSNKVVTKWKENLSLPGSENNFFIEASPNSLCALTVTDKATKLVTETTSFNEDQIFKEVDKFEATNQIENFSNRCRDDLEFEKKSSTNDMEPLSYPQEPNSRFIDSLEAFNDFGALVITDLDLETRPCMEKRNEEMTNATTRNSKLNVFGSEIENISLFKAEEVLISNERNSQKSLMSYDFRTFFPETWIWDLVPINNSGTANLNVTVPHALTEWTAETVCLSSAKGLGLSKSSSLVTYKPFFLDFAVPHSLKRKEIFHLHVSVFNYEMTDLPVKITLSTTKGLISRSEEFHSYCVKTKSKIVHRFVLEPLTLGEAEIKVKAETDFSFARPCGKVSRRISDTVVKKILIKYEGFPVEEIKSGFICSSSSNFDHQIAWNIKIPPDVVESSIEVKAFVSGDILGPSLKNIDHLITLPTGCGEQNMILLAPNILLLDYLLLKKPDQLELIEKALINLDLGYQRQLNYQRPDGSYSAFGNEDEKGSIWLTAFVVRYLSQAKKYIYIDENDLNSSISWITKHQLENGCFPKIGKIYHRKLQEKLMEEESSKTLTAYILISLLEAGISLENPVVKNAIYCLKPTEESLGIYGDLLSSYALILAGEYRDSQALMRELIKEAKRSYGVLWWENNDSIESSIEMTGYGILSLIKLGGSWFLTAASDAVRWVIQHQNQYGGFFSSQDTILALEAISKFSSILPRTEDNDALTVNLQTLEEKYVFNITSSNKLLRQEIALPSYLTRAHFESTGKGCALVQTSTRYNVRRTIPNESFKIQLRINSLSDVDRNSIARFQICVRYKSPRDKIIMAVLEVPMVSGYYPDRASLYEIQTSKKGVRRWEEYEDKINFYFEDLKNKKVCVNFLVVQEVCIENAAPALIKLYDYYNTHIHTTMKYNLVRECQNDSWLPINSQDLKQESKRDLNFQDEYRLNNHTGGNFEGFMDLDHDLETPNDEREVLPVFALPPKVEEARGCPHCLQTTPEIFSKLYCSSDIAVKVLIVSPDAFEFHLDVSPRRNFTTTKRIVFFTVKKKCDCPVLNSVNNYALLLITPPRYFRIHSIQELHLDDSVQLYPWDDPADMPDYLKSAISFCESLSQGDVP